MRARMMAGKLWRFVESMFQNLEWLVVVVGWTGRAFAGWLRSLFNVPCSILASTGASPKQWLVGAHKKTAAKGRRVANRF